MIEEETNKNLIRPVFTPLRTEEERDLDISKVIPVRLNTEERVRLNASKKILQQSKDSTAIKMLAEIGFIVLHDQLTGKIIRAVFDNKRRNERTGVGEVE